MICSHCSAALLKCGRRRQLCRCHRCLHGVVEGGQVFVDARNARHQQTLVAAQRSLQVFCRARAIVVRLSFGSYHAADDVKRLSGRQAAVRRLGRVASWFPAIASHVEQFECAGARFARRLSPPMSRSLNAENGNEPQPNRRQPRLLAPLPYESRLRVRRQMPVRLIRGFIVCGSNSIAVTFVR